MHLPKAGESELCSLTVCDCVVTCVVNLDKLLEARDHVSVLATVVSLAQHLEHSRYLI